MNLLHQADNYGESDDAATVIGRWWSGIFKVVSECQNGDQALIVTHGNFIRALVESMGIDTRHNYPANAGMTTVAADQFGSLKMLTYNRKF